MSLKSSLPSLPGLFLLTMGTSPDSSLDASASCFFMRSYRSSSIRRWSRAAGREESLVGVGDVAGKPRERKKKRKKEEG